jgi:hypothetical protein
LTVCSMVKVSLCSPKTGRLSEFLLDSETLWDMEV